MWRYKRVNSGSRRREIDDAEDEDEEEVDESRGLVASMIESERRVKRRNAGGHFDNSALKSAGNSESGSESSVRDRNRNCRMFGSAASFAWL